VFGACASPPTRAFARVALCRGGLRAGSCGFRFRKCVRFGHLWQAQRRTLADTCPFAESARRCPPLGFASGGVGGPAPVTGRDRRVRRADAPVELARRHGRPAGGLRSGLLCSGRLGVRLAAVSSLQVRLLLAAYVTEGQRTRRARRRSFAEPIPTVLLPEVFAAKPPMTGLAVHTSARCSVLGARCSVLGAGHAAAGARTGPGERRWPARCGCPRISGGS
ncbi:MAG: hypothetical protein QOJ50_2263, partial [Cryptosporangiaceae bacterium]|nr:hypothetical protein [Cryptosporangiaceae bacterium]